MSRKKKSKLPQEFWAVNASNLFERGAYYGMLAVFSYHLIYNVGLESWTVGILTGISMGMINFLPLISTALASKYGFKKLLLFSYVTLAIGYVVLGFGYSLALIALAVVIMGTGSGFEKALIAASISYSSDEKNRDYAFNVYYWVINFGAFLIPLSLTFLFVPEGYGGVFFLMAAFIIGSFLIILLAYKNPVKPDPSISAFKAVKNLKVILEDRKFVIVLLIFSGCWFMLYTRKPFMPVFMTDFNILPTWYIPIIAALNPGTIITLGQVWAYIIKDRNINSLKLLIAGIIIISLGFIIAGFSMNPVLFLFGLIVLSFGELVSYPAFLSYVSKIPPDEKRSIYMGYSFLPLAIAGVTAPIAGGFLYYTIAEGMGMGRLFWGIIASIGLISASAFLHYDKHYNSKKKVKSWGNGLFNIFRSRITSKIIPNIPLFFIPLVLILGLSLGADPIYRGALAEEEDLINEEDEKRWKVVSEQFSFQGNLMEGKSVSWDILTPDGGYILSVDLDLRWEDEPDFRRIRRFENTEDTFSMKLMINDSEIIQSSEVKEYDDASRIHLFYDAELQDIIQWGKGKVKVELVECGNFYPKFGLGLMSIDDSSNSYDIHIDVTYNVPTMKR
ncbi:MAG TPA: MFS transporter [Candidatus Thermoplasmatota archaeon]|nr:MFS transporter [Candidatus Thermoplasmatota archaeon]